MTFAEAMAAEQRQLNLKATIQCVDGFIINATEIMSVSIDEGGQMPLGSAVSARYTLELPNADGEYLRNGAILGNRSLTGARVTIQIGVYHDGAWDWQPLGLFIVEKTSAREHDTRIRLTGNDPLISLDVAYGADITYRNNTTLNDILTHIRSKGFTINGTLATNGTSVINFTPDWGDEPTVREVLGYVAQICGSFVRCDRSGNIELVPANGSTTHTITTDRYLEFTDDERYFNFNRIKVLPYGAKKSESHVQASVTSAAESAANTIVIEGNPLFKTKSTTTYSKATSWREGRRYYLKIGNKYVYDEEPDEIRLSSYYVANTTRNTTNLQAMVNNLKTALTGMSFRALNFTWRGNPQVMVGDKVSIVDTRGVTTTTVNLQQTLRFDRGFKSEISCPLDLQAVYPSTITSSGRVVPPYFGEGSIDGSVIVPESITGDLIVAGGVSARNVAAKSITADEIAAKSITADEIAAKTITADEIEAKTITADEIAAETITADEIGASQITATHIGTNEIVANAANIKDGVITNAKIANGTIENAKIKDATIETAKIKDAAITTAKIADAQVTNAKIANATIETAKIKDAAITTAKIKDAQITNAKIAAAGIDFANIKDVVAGTSIFRQGVGDALYLDRLVVNDANFASAIAGKLMIRDTDGKLYRISVNSSGAVTATQVQVNGDSLTDNAVMSVSQRLLWRQATQPSAPWVGMLWLDTTTEKLKRCTAITPSVAWEVVPAGEVHTAVTDVDDTGMTILSGGNLNLLAGGNLNIKNLGNTANVINMDNTGMTLSSTGQLKLQSTDSIIIGGSPFGVGGTNLVRNSRNLTALSPWLSVVTPAEVVNNAALFYNDLGQIRIPGAAETEYLYQPLNTNAFKAGDQYTVSFWAYGSASIVVRVGDTYYSNVLLNTGVIAPKYSLSGTGGSYYEATATISSETAAAPRFYVRFSDASGNLYITRIQLEKGTMATDWSPSPADPASGVKTSKIEIGSDFIDVASGGTLTLNAADDIKIGAGGDTLANTIDLSANDSIKLAVTSQSANLFPSDPSSWEQGHISAASGLPSASTTRIRTGYITLDAGTLYTVSRVKSLTSQIYLHYYNSSNAYIGNSGEYVTTYPYSFSLPSGATKMRVVVRTATDSTIVPTDVPGILFSIVPAGVSGGVKTSSVEVNSNGIYMDTTGDFSLNAGVNVNIRGGSGTSEIGLSNSASLPFLWAGGTSSTAPFRVQRDGSVIATKIQHEMPYTFWDMADATFPAEFPVYIPSGYTIDSVTFTFQTKKARTFAKSAASGGGVVNTDTGGGTAGIDNITVTVNSASITTTGAPNHTHTTLTNPSGSAGAHNHTNSHGHSASASYSMVEHTHKMNLPGHAHGLNYGINEKATLATSCALKVGATTIGTYSPNPSNPVELKAYMSAGWNTVIVAPNNDARIVAFALVKLTPA